jgi:hypothetical protein
MTGGRSGGRNIARALVLASLAAVWLAAPAAAAPAPAGVDRDHGVRFDLTGPTLTVTLLDVAETREAVWGQRVRAACAARFSGRGAVHTELTWPDGATELVFAFDRDISDRVKWCLIEAAGGGGDIAAFSWVTPIRVHGTTAQDRRMGRRLRAYMRRSADPPPWLRRVFAIVVDRRRIAVVTTLRRNRQGRRGARELCRVIQGSDVADFTPGHRVLGLNDVLLRRCRARPVP